MTAGFIMNDWDTTTACQNWAALGVAQMRKLTKILAMRQRVADNITKIKDIPGVQLPYQDRRVKMSWFVYVIRLAPISIGKRLFPL